MSLFQNTSKVDKEENVTMDQLGTIMTILVGKKKKTEKFSALDLDFFHQECEQGTIKLTPSSEGGVAYKLSFECQRCHMHTCIGNQDNVEKALLAMTQVALSNKIYNTNDTYKNTKIVFQQK